MYVTLLLVFGMEMKGGVIVVFFKVCDGEISEGFSKLFFMSMGVSWVVFPNEVIFLSLVCDVHIYLSSD